LGKFWQKIAKYGLKLAKFGLIKPENSLLDELCVGFFGKLPTF